MTQHPSSRRDPFIDAVRVVALSIVVVGHWMTTAVFRDGEELAWQNALSVIPESHVATWVLQVMPLLFFVGGFANARSLASHQGDHLAFLRTRLIRLVRPTVAFIAVWVAIGLLAEAGAWSGVERAADVAALPFWFLGLYVAVVALAPPMVSLHLRFGWRVVVVLVVGAAATDVLVHGLGVEVAGVLNYAFVWLLPHQLGITYASGDLDAVRGRAAALVAAAGLVGLLALVVGAGYPMSMIGVPGEERWNTDPPSLALVALTMWLVGLALLTRPWVAAWPDGLQRLVGRLNRITLTLYVWHVTVIAIGAALLVWLGFPEHPTGSRAWWSLRVVWLLVLVPITAVVVALFRRFEVHPAVRPITVDRRRARTASVSVGVVSMALALIGFGVTGFDHLAADRGESVLGFSMNPLMGLAHLVVGLAVGYGAYASRPIGVATVAAFVYLVLAVAGWSDGISVFATNPAMARLHLTLGVVGGVTLVAAARRDRSPGRGFAVSRVGTDN